MISFAIKVRGRHALRVIIPLSSHFSLLISLLSVIVFAACSNDNGRFRIEGNFKNLNQGEFYLYSQENGIKDTIAVNDGHFAYERQMTDTMTLVMLFPNFSEIPVFARPNIELKMEGDATHLKETTVTGSPENEAMTAFRTSTSEKMPPDVLKEARKFITDNPESPVSVYLLQKMFIQTATPDYSEAFKLCSTLHKHQPGNIPLTRLYTQLQLLKDIKKDGTLPAFKAKATNGQDVNATSMKSKANVIIAWATWSTTSLGILTTIKSLTKDNPGKISVVSICMNSNKNEGKDILERDSITWPDICDGQMWQSPVVEALGITTVPANIVADSRGKIVGRNLSLPDLKEKVSKLIEAP